MFIIGFLYLFLMSYSNDFQTIELSFVIKTAFFVFTKILPVSYWFFCLSLLLTKCCATCSIISIGNSLCICAKTSFLVCLLAGFCIFLNLNSSLVPQFYY